MFLYVLLQGSSKGTLNSLNNSGIPIVVPIVDEPMNLDDAMENGEALLEKAAERLLIWGRTLSKVMR